jgi:uncharacterized protein (DUF302 family)
MMGGMNPMMGGMNPGMMGGMNPMMGGMNPGMMGGMNPMMGMMNPMMGMMNPMMGMMNPMMGMMNPGMMGGMNPGMMMNPMMGMMNPMMGMMNPMMGSMNPMMGMMNPMMGSVMNPMTGMMMNPTIDSMTHTGTLDNMMRNMDPKMILAMMGGTYEKREDDDLPNVLPIAKIPGFPTQTFRDHPVNTMSASISDEGKKNAIQSMMMMSPLSVRDMLSMITYKVPLEDGVTWDDAVESMKLLANEVNFKFVGSSPFSKEVEALTEAPTPRIEIFRFCDAVVARKVLDYMPEFVVFFPCKITMIEDADGKIWIVTLDWDVSWLDYAQNPNSHLTKELRADATRIRENIRYIMEGAASGDI